MTNQEIDKVVADSDRSASIGIFFPVAASWFFSGLALLMSVLVGPTSAADSLLNFFLWLGVGFSGVSAYATLSSMKTWQQREKERARLTWEYMGRNQTFGTALSEATRRLGNDVQKIYNGDPTGKIFPLRQSIRLVDTHSRQQQRLFIVENRLGELRGLQESLAGKMAQLHELGEDYPQGARNLEQINADLEALGRVHGQIRGSCTRLEAIVIGVQKAVQSRQLRRELEGLSARVAPSNGAIESAFEAESLEDIERQIGREIETYLRLERETEEHLR